jgi:hypothetical protein
MLDENDLRTACTALAAQAPTIKEAAHLIPSADDARRSRRPVVLGSAVVATAAAVAVPTSLGVLRSDPPAISGPTVSGQGNDSLIYRAFDLTVPAGWLEQGRTFSDISQWNTMLGPAGALCNVRVYEPGRFDPGRIPPSSQPLTVNGKPGYFAQITNPYDRPPPNREKRWAVVWQYDENAWAMSICEGRSPADQRQKEEQMANATTFGQDMERVPMKLGHVPEGFEPGTAGVRDPRIAGGFKYDYDLSFTWTDAGGRERQVFVAYVAGEKLDQVRGTPLSIGGLPARYDGVHLLIQGNGFQALVMAPHGLPGDQRTEMIRIAESLEFAPRPMDTSTWFDGAHALP